jgi:hypothetical protein
MDAASIAMSDMDDAAKEVPPPIDAGNQTAPYPMHLADTGLYSSTGAIADGVLAYTPKYALWSDGAEKKRWLYLPPGTQIDTSDMDAWVYPVGTKAWKEFTRDGKRVETRLLYKRRAGTDADAWLMLGYAWNEAGTDAVAAPDGVQGALGTMHDIPPQQKCTDCHGGIPDHVLGVTAIQLSHNLAGLKLADLAASGSLTSAPASGGYTLPGDATAQAALGYLHANCGQCHNPHGDAFEKTNMVLWLSVSELGAIDQTSTYRTTVGVSVRVTSPPFQNGVRIKAGDSAMSVVYERMSTRSASYQMPPLASKLVDPTGTLAVQTWIDSL